MVGRRDVVQHDEAARTAERRFGEGHLGRVGVVHRDVRAGEATCEVGGELLVDLHRGQPLVFRGEDVGRPSRTGTDLERVRAEVDVVREHPRQQIAGEERRPLVRRKPFEVLLVHVSPCASCTDGSVTPRRRNDTRRADRGIGLAR